MPGVAPATPIGVPMRHLQRRATALLAAIVLAAAVLLAASPALAETTTPTVTLKVKAPIAVRKNVAFTLSGSAGVAAAPGETVTISLARKGANWSVMSTATATLSASRTFSLKVKATKSGHWRVSASLEGTSAHLPASASARFKAVGSKVIALTFDDGPWPTSTARIVSALKAGDAQATFFMLGSQVGSRKKLAKSVVDNGNLVGVHSWNHAFMTRRSSSVNAADLARCKKAVKAATGVTPTWFRPPYGATSSSLRKAAAGQGLRQVIWTVDTLDWKYRTTSSVVSRTMSGARNGSVVLMHDGGGPRAATAAAVPIVIRKLRAKGYDFATLDEMVALGYKIR
jgi:peptidoglycan/xylan/chitin deacetylase (PgdA/CDA1 family)